ncbi:unnamed protein product [Coffea canephora]|uniref:tRNA 4-demethylwyosine synthase (AdoMet-dependent) n=1 Tax=Coffea canephora TaxID=49390 RepID=A0A068UIR7_COFCA|nr:unnamed protein product [Coffea canephora]
MSPSLSPTRLTLLTLLSATTLYLFYKSHRRLLHRLKTFKTLNPDPRGKIFFISQTSTSKGLAQRLHNLLTLNNLPFDLIDPKDYEPEDLCKETLVLVIASTWENGEPPQNGAFLVNWVNESAEDFRVGAALLVKCKFAVFGVGSRAYGETFNAVGKGLSGNLRKLGAKELLEICEGDVDGGDLDKVFDGWSQKVVEALTDNLKENGVYFGNLNGVDGEASDEEEYDDEDDEEGENGGESELVDLEDIAGKGPSRRKEMVEAKANGELNGVTGKKAMVTPVIRANLEKQGYKVIGSHSGVKLCRWTKSQLRGRGGCYKHSFYGIESHRCMEATPSLACANKCVFCWRHHTNPVGKSWQWKMDDPLEIVNTAIELHTKMIRQMKGVPGKY